MRTHAPHSLQLARGYRRVRRHGPSGGRLLAQVAEGISSADASGRVRMLSIGKIAAGPAAARYYTDQVARGREDYYVAVGEVRGYLERNACRARRGAGGQMQVDGRGFVAAAFVHRASREGDPLLHTHVVAGNLTEGPDGRWTALDARHLYRQAKTAGYL